MEPTAVGRSTVLVSDRPRPSSSTVTLSTRLGQIGLPKLACGELFVRDYVPYEVAQRYLKSLAREFAVDEGRSVFLSITPRVENTVHHLLSVT